MTEDDVKNNERIYGMNIAVCVLAGLCGLLVVAVAVLVYLWQKAKAEPGETKSQLEQLQQAVKMERENFEARMLEKDRVCQNALKEKDAACQKLIDAKDKSCADAIAEKAATCERLIADKESACSTQYKYLMLMMQYISDRSALRGWNSYTQKLAKDYLSTAKSKAKVPDTFATTKRKPCACSFGAAYSSSSHSVSKLPSTTSR